MLTRYLDSTPPVRALTRRRGGGDRRRGGTHRLLGLLIPALALWLLAIGPAAAQDTSEETPPADTTATETPTEELPIEPPAEPTITAEAEEESGDGTTRVVAEDLNLRAEPSLEAEVLTVMPVGAAVTVATDAEAQDDFLPVTYDGTAGWAHMAYLVPEGKDNLATVVEGLNLRAEVGADADVLLVIPAGDQVRVFGQAEDVDGTTWSRVRYDDTSGWVATELLTTGESDDGAAVDLAGQERIALTDVNLRGGPSTDDEILLVIPAGGSLALTDEGQENGFVTVTYEGTGGWVLAELIARPDEIDAAPAEESATDESTTEGADESATESAEDSLAGQQRVTLEATGLLGEPNAESTVLAEISAGATVTLTGEFGGDGYVGVEFDGTTGWLPADLLGE